MFGFRAALGGCRLVETECIVADTIICIELYSFYCVFTISDVIPVALAQLSFERTLWRSFLYAPEADTPSSLPPRLELVWAPRGDSYRWDAAPRGILPSVIVSLITHILI